MPNATQTLGAAQVSMATYIIGDIQGCYDPLRRVLDKAGFQPESDQLWAVGDLINRGPDSLSVTRFLRALGSSFLSVLGNHDLHFLAVAHGFRKSRKKDTLDALLAADDRHELVTWFQSLPLAFYRQGTLVVHAGVPPSWTLEETLARAGEVETWLRGPQIGDFLANMYGDTPDHFANDQTALVRARTITNALTRMRFCTADGRLDFEAKGGPNHGPSHMRPWFEHDGRALRHTPIAFGHWAMLQGRVAVPNVLALDTGCVWSQTLTLLRLDDGVRFECGCS